MKGWTAAAALLVLSIAGPAHAQAGAAAWSAGKLYLPASLSTTGMACESTTGGGAG